ncbi:DUF1353 domain-containing protein [Nocardia flavorosea]|uniref:DUF1353 domain-containing protein n=1 Tax=Nocardia flavorosea TaxID=53429 RepID=A0A846YII6_9NOCA|nr:DUF1353 domain-containing protein [Nocardia flavorosea]NKY58675.1 DUF1353 domain-containing protein [Nocardia flavorosea]
MGFTSSLVVEEIDGEFWKVREPLTYQGADEVFEIPADFRTDFASVPRPLVWLIPRYGVYTRAAILHDFLVRTERVSRADADGIFRRTLRECDVSRPRRWMMWAAVRLGGGLRGISPAAFAVFLLIAVPSVIFLAIPTVVVTVFLVLFWCVELIAWVVDRFVPPDRRTRVPRPQMRT